MIILIYTCSYLYIGFCEFAWLEYVVLFGCFYMFKALQMDDI